VSGVFFSLFDEFFIERVHEAALDKNRNGFVHFIADNFTF
jgi:hypothetical protein